VHYLPNLHALFSGYLLDCIWVQNCSFKRCPCSWKAQCTQYQGWPFSWWPPVQFAGEDCHFLITLHVEFKAGLCNAAGFW